MLFRFVSQDAPAGKPPTRISDRPDFTESSEVIRPGDVQWESGFSWARAGGSRSSLLGAPLARIGFGRWLELRLSSDGLASERTEGQRMRGWSDPSVGFKWKVLDESRWLPAVGIIPAVSMPRGRREFSSGSSDPAVKFTWAKDALLGFALSGNVSWASLTDEMGRMAQRAATLSVGHDLGQGFGGYWEVYRFSRERTRRRPGGNFLNGTHARPRRFRAVGPLRRTAIDARGSRLGDLRGAGHPEFAGLSPAEVRDGL